jgi:hypothetical protein
VIRSSLPPISRLPSSRSVNHPSTSSYAPATEEMASGVSALGMVISSPDSLSKTSWRPFSV